MVKLRTFNVSRINEYRIYQGFQYYNVHFLFLLFLILHPQAYSFPTLSKTKSQCIIFENLGRVRLLQLSLFPLYCFYISILHGNASCVSSMIDNESQLYVLCILEIYVSKKTRLYHPKHPNQILKPVEYYIDWHNVSSLPKA